MQKLFKLKSSIKPFFRNFSEAEKVKFKFIYLNDKREVPAEAVIGDHILKVAKQYGITLEGACDASLACSTCHVILERPIYDSLKSPGEQEEDLLDLTFDVSETSRLGCQTIVAKNFEGTNIYIPTATKNIQAINKRM
jgi:2Fe-2S ferredoxin